ncbi:MAG: hypothetical protein JKX79_12935 [Labilibaculum sp.]|nr:hypothetical protein [Labilibaculum sp.]
MKNIFKIIMLLSIGLFLNSCYYDAYPEEEISTPDNDGGEVPTEVSFQIDIQPIFGKCVGCHGGNQNPNLTEGNAYSSLVPAYVKANDANGSKLFKKLNDGHQGGVSNDKLALIKAWINDGAKNN